MSGKKNQGQDAAPPAPTPETTPSPPANGEQAPPPAADAPVEGADAAREQLEKLAEERKTLDDAQATLKLEQEELAKAREQLEKDRAALDALKSGKPKREPRLIRVKALKGVIDDLRVQHRNAGEEFRMREDLAETLEGRGEVEIL